MPAAKDQTRSEADERKWDEPADLIAELVTVMEFVGSSEDVARICHAHPTLSEAVREAAMAVEKRAIHA